MIRDQSVLRYKHYNVNLPDKATQMNILIFIHCLRVANFLMNLVSLWIELLLAVSTLDEVETLEDSRGFSVVSSNLLPTESNSRQNLQKLES